MTLKAVLGALAIVLGPHWAVSDEEARAWGKALEAWVKAQPPKKRKAMAQALGAVPTLNLVVATGMVLAPRVQAQIAMGRAKQEVNRGKGGTGTDAGGDSGSASPSTSPEPPSWANVDAVKRLYAQHAGGPSGTDSPADSPDRPTDGGRAKA